MKKPVFKSQPDFWTCMSATDLSGQRILGLDLGSKTIGLAISDGSYQVASPLETIRRSKFRKDAEQLASIIDARNVGGLIFGWPLHLDGTVSPRCQATQDFACELQLLSFTMPMTFWDERLTTQAVERFLVRDQDMNRKRRAEVVDKMAAALILQNALDAKR